MNLLDQLRIVLADGQFAARRETGRVTAVEGTKVYIRNRFGTRQIEAPSFRLKAGDYVGLEGGTVITGRRKPPPKSATFSV